MEDQLQTLAILNGEAFSSVVIYLTVLSSYLVVAYLVGKDLSTTQLAIISTLFVFFALYFAIGADNWFRAAVQYSESVGMTFTSLSRLLLWLLLAGIIAALWFMFDQRKNRDNDT